jgi:AraC-like DNA-binding protein
MLLASDHIHHQTSIVTVGTFDCPVEARNFANTGPIHQYLIAFPRTSVAIEYSDRAARFVADPNIVSIYNRGQRYVRHAVSSYGDLCDWIAINPSVLVEMLAAIGVPKPCNSDPLALLEPTHTCVDAQLFAGIRGLVDLSAHGRGADLLELEERALDLFARVLKQAYSETRALTPEGATKTSQARHRELVERSQRYLAHNFCHSLSLGAIARHLGTSPFHLNRVFRQAIGITLHRYVLQLRVRQALVRLLEQPQCDLTSLALDLGFADHSHFSATFRREFGFPPRRVRELPAAQLLQALHVHRT